MRYIRSEIFTLACDTVWNWTLLNQHSAPLPPVCWLISNCCRRSTVASVEISPAGAAKLVRGRAYTTPTLLFSKLMTFPEVHCAWNYSDDPDRCANEVHPSILWPLDVLLYGGAVEIEAIGNASQIRMIISPPIISGSILTVNSSPTQPRVAAAITVCYGVAGMELVAGCRDCDSCSCCGGCGCAEVSWCWCCCCGAA